MDETEVRTRNRNRSRKDGVYKFCLQWRDNILEKAALDRVLNEREEKELVDLAPPRVLLIRKEKIEKTVNIDKIIFYLKFMYLTHNEEPRIFIDDIPTDESSFEAMTNCIKDDEILALKICVYLVVGF